MHNYINRDLEKVLLHDLNYFPVVAVLGARQSGKSTLVKAVGKKFNNFVYLDLESQHDLNKLTDPELFFKNNSREIICFDEIQRKPDLFPVLRSIIDRDYFKGKIIILGSASQNLIQESSESLAGRISYLELTPFFISELVVIKDYDINIHWLRGGFPRSYLAPTLKLSKKWRENFIKTFIEMDIPQLGKLIPSLTLNRLYTMCAHLNGQVLNTSKIGESLGISYHTISNYIDLSEQTFILRTLQPYSLNIKKRIIKRPKLYFRDTGLLHTILGIDNFNDLLGNPVFGSSWESFALENILAHYTDYRAFFFRTSNGTEIDLILEKGNKKIGIEFKASSSPKVTNSFFNALRFLNIKEAWIIAPIDEKYEIKKGVTVSGLSNFIV